MKKYKVWVQDWHSGYITVNATDEDAVEIAALNDIDNMVCKDGGTEVIRVEEINPDGGA